MRSQARIQNSDAFSRRKKKIRCFAMQIRSSRALTAKLNNTLLYTLNSRTNFNWTEKLGQRRNDYKRTCKHKKAPVLSHGCQPPSSPHFRPMSRKRRLARTCTQGKGPSRNDGCIYSRQEAASQSLSHSHSHSQLSYKGQLGPLIPAFGKTNQPLLWCEKDGGMLAISCC